MHKIFLTEPEVSIIKGADDIVREFGGFPSMENGRICDIQVRMHGYSRYDVSLFFDIEGWAQASSLYAEIPNSAYRFIRLDFHRARSVYLNDLNFTDAGEIKFGNTMDREKMLQDIHSAEGSTVCSH